MRQARIKIPAAESEAAYHCISRTVNGEWLFNKSHGRFGTLWAERFKSVLVETEERVRQTMAAYIDLNGVRAGLVTDPKDYRFCGYAEAGIAAAQEGVSSKASFFLVGLSKPKQKKVMALQLLG